MANRLFLGRESGKPILKVSEIGNDAVTDTNPRHFLLNTELAGNLWPVLQDETHNVNSHSTKTITISQGAGTTLAFSYAFYSTSWPIGISYFAGDLDFAVRKWIHHSVEYYDASANDYAALLCEFLPGESGSNNRKYFAQNNFNTDVQLRIVEYGTP